MHLWTDGAGWIIRNGDAAPRPLQAGDALSLGTQTLQVVELPSQTEGPRETALAGRLDAPLRIEGYFDTVQIHREGRDVLVLSGAAARLLCELPDLALLRKRPDGPIGLVRAISWLREVLLPRRPGL